MNAVKNGMVITIANDIAQAMSGITKGYSVVLHGLPKFTTRVEADTPDQAHDIALKLAQSEGLCLKLTGATIQRI